MTGTEKKQVRARIGRIATGRSATKPSGERIAEQIWSGGNSFTGLRIWEQGGEWHWSARLGKL